MPGRIQSVERAAAILRLLSSGSRRLGVVELSRALELPKGTVHGILATLQHVGFVEQDRASGKYQVGATLLHLGNSYLDVNELRARAINWADALATRSRETVFIGTVHEGRMLVIHHVFRPDDSLQVLEVGASLPLFDNALGKVLLAFDAEGDELLKTVAPDAVANSAARRPDLAEQIRRIRGDGWGAEIEESIEGEASIAAPIRDERGVTLGAIGIRGAIERLCTAERNPRPDLVSYVRDAARSVSRDLGASRW